MSGYIGDTDVIQLLALSTFSGCFTRLCADDVKSRQFRNTSVRASLGFNVKSQCDHTSFFRFHSAPCRSSSSSQHSDWLEPWSSCWWEALWRPCNFPPIHSLTGPVGQPFASCLGGSGSRPGDAPTLTMITMSH
jgi:hypothetical protein